MNRHTRLYGFVALVYTALAVLWTCPAWLAPDRLIGKPGDPISYAWGAAWVPFALGHLLNPFYTYYLNAPTGANYMWPAPILLYDIAVWPLTAALGPIFAYNSIMVLAVASTGVTTFLLLRRFTSRLFLPLVASALFTFGPYMAAESSLGHPDLTAVGAVPALALTLHELLVRQRTAPWRLGLVLAGLTVVQLITSETVLLSCAVVFGIGGVVLLMLEGYRLRRRLTYVVSASKWAALCLPVILGYVTYQWFEPGALHGLIQLPGNYGASALSFFLPSGMQALSPGVAPAAVAFLAGPNQELCSYIGVPLLILVWTVWRRKPGSAEKWLLWMIGVSVVLAVGPTLIIAPNIRLTNPLYFLSYVPVLRDILPVRFSLYIDLFLTLLLTLELSKERLRPLVSALVLVCVSVVWLPPVVMPYETAPTPQFFTKAVVSRSVRYGSAVLVLPYAANGATDIAMLWQAESGFRFRMPEGYWVRLGIGAEGNQYGPAETNFTRDLYRVETLGFAGSMGGRGLSEGIRYLRTHHVSVVALGPCPHEQALRRFVQAVLKRAPTFVGGAFVWRIASCDGSCPT